MKMKNRKDLATSVMYILPGSMFQEMNGFNEGIPATLLTLFGCGLGIVGLNMLHGNLDDQGSKGLSMLKTAIFIFIVAVLIDNIPFLGVLATIGLICAFGLQLYGLSLLKSSTVFTSTGKDGILYLMIAMGLALVASVLGLVPWFGGYLSSFAIVGVLVLLFFGWLKVYEDIIMEKI